MVVFKKKVMVIFLTIIVFSAIVIFINSYNSKGTKDEVSINYLTNDKNELNVLNEMKFDIIFGAPHHSGFISYRYSNETFLQSEEEYVSSPIGEESTKYINEIINLDDSVKTYHDIRVLYGQISLIKEVDGFVFVIFDGFFNEYDKEGFKKNVIFKLDNKNNSYEKMEIELLTTEFINEFDYVNDKMFFITINDVYTDNEPAFEFVVYEMRGNIVSRNIINRNTIPYNIKSIYSIEGNLYFSYFDTGYNEKLKTINLSTFEELGEINLGTDSKIEYLFYNKNGLYILSSMDNSVSISNTDENLNLKNNYFVEIDEYMNINKALYNYNKDSFYIVIKENPISASMYKFATGDLEKILSFELNTKINDLFYYNIFLN